MIDIDMLQRVLDLFPVNTEALFLVSDPDGVLADEAILAALSSRGFQLVRENDPILFRYRIEQLKPFVISNPVLVITEGVLEDLPYDMWQLGRHIHLALHEFFPTLAYSIIRALTPVQRARLGQIALPSERLGEQQTIRFLLEHVFHFNISLMQQPAYILLWLDEFHQSLAPLPTPIMNYVLEELEKCPAYQRWRLKGMIEDYTTFREFLQEQWQIFLAKQTGKAIGEGSNKYLLHFESTPGLQDALPRLLRNGSLTPVHLEMEANLPAWVTPGVFMSDDDPRLRRFTELMDLLNDALSNITDETRWGSWQAVAYQWAELNNLSNDLDVSVTDGNNHLKTISLRLDPAFTAWLSRNYSSLASKSLPSPHHVYHVPHYLNYLRSQDPNQRVALVVMDGMSLSDWLLIRPIWQIRNPSWQMKEKLLLAQIPTITAISRYALISGLRPADFYVSHGTNLSEVKAWTAFWTNRELPENGIALLPMKLRQEDLIPEITNPRLQALCLIERQIDEIMHQSLLGPRDHQSGVKLWLSPHNSIRNSTSLEKVISLLLEANFTVFLASDHGHCAASGIGRPNEGLIARSRGRRARVYSDRRLAEETQAVFGGTIIWEDDGILPDDIFVLIPAERHAFTEHNEPVITHGGITLDEIIVPLVQINKNDNG